MSTTIMPHEPPTMEDKIIHCLNIYPILSPSMLQVGIGTNQAPAEWKLVLRKLVEEGRVLETTLDTKTATGRYFSYTRLMLPETSHNC